MKRDISKTFDLPAVDYFEYQNVYSGSMGGDFNYKISPAGEAMTASTWYGMNCDSKNEIQHSADFPVTEEGIVQMIQWLEEQHHAFRCKKKE